MTQLKYLQILSQLCGESGKFTGSSTAADYVEWAKTKNINLKWNPKAKLSSAILAESLVQLFGLSPRKYGGDLYRILEREGIVIERTPAVTAEVLAALVDNPVVAQRAFLVAGSPTSPTTPANGNGAGYGWQTRHSVPKSPPPRSSDDGRGTLPRPR